MSKKLTALTFITTCLLTGCTQSPIDAKKTQPGNARTITSQDKSPQLTDKDIFGNETTLAVSEEDIQAALETDMFRVPLNSSVILVQSGNRAPEAIMQQEMSKYYKVATISGIPDRQKAVICNKDERQSVAVAENMNWMQALRFVAAKGHQKAIVVYMDTLQSGSYDSATKSLVWSDYKNEKLTSNVSLRYLVRFTLVDVATGEWATWSPVNEEFKIQPSLPGKKDDAEMTAEQQIYQLKQKTYASMVKDLVSRFQ